MADDGSTQAQTTWPLVKLSFKVMWDGAELIIQEVTGLSSETQTIEYRPVVAALYILLCVKNARRIQKFSNITPEKRASSKETRHCGINMPGIK